VLIPEFHSFCRLHWLQTLGCLFFRHKNCYYFHHLIRFPRRFRIVLRQYTIFLFLLLDTLLDVGHYAAIFSYGPKHTSWTEGWRAPCMYVRRGWPGLHCADPIRQQRLSPRIKRQVREYEGEQSKNQIAASSIWSRSITGALLYEGTHHLIMRMTSHGIRLLSDRPLPDLLFHLANLCT